MIRPMIATLVTALLLSGCAHVMSDANLKLADRSLSYADMKKNPDGSVGKIVLVGGIIAGVNTSGDVAMLEVTQLELLQNGVPDEYSHSSGRFLAVSTELIDPIVYRPGSLVTIIGEIKGKKVQQLNGADYPYPLLAVRELRIFRPTEPFPAATANPYQNQIGDSKFNLRPPGPPDGEPRRP